MDRLEEKECILVGGSTLCRNNRPGASFSKSECFKSVLLDLAWPVLTDSVLLDTASAFGTSADHA